MFSELADKTLDKIVQIVEDSDEAGNLDIDYSDGMIEITEAEGKVFVINRHSAAQQMWLASPISGPHHFEYKKDKWISTRSEDIRLDSLLTSELGINLKGKI